MSKYSQISDDSTKSSFIDFSPIPNIGSELKFSDDCSIHIPNYMQNIFTNKFNKLVATTQLVLEKDNYSQGLKYKSCILSKDNKMPQIKTVRFSESIIKITKEEQKSVYPCSNELYFYEKSNNYSEDYINFVVEVSNIDLDKNSDKKSDKNSKDNLLDGVVEAINTDLEKKSDIVRNTNSDIIVEKPVSKKYKIICNCFSFIFK